MSTYVIEVDHKAWPSVTFATVAEARHKRGLLGFNVQFIPNSVPPMWNVYPKE